MLSVNFYSRGFPAWQLCDVTWRAKFHTRNFLSAWGQVDHWNRFKTLNSVQKYNGCALNHNLKAKLINRINLWTYPTKGNAGVYYKLWYFVTTLFLKHNNMPPNILGVTGKSEVGNVFWIPTPRNGTYRLFIFHCLKLDMKK